MRNFELLDPKNLTGPILPPGGVLLESQFSSIDHPPRDDRPLHIPGAIRVHPSYFEAGTDRSRYYPHYRDGDGNLLPNHELTAAIERLGITPDTPVVVYGREPEGTMAAARVVWALLYAGVHAVSLLDGGLDAWLETGGETTNSIPDACDPQWTSPDTANESAWTIRTHLRASTEEVREATTNSNRMRLVDVRRRGEWDGSATDHYPFYSDAGHIPTALHQGDWDTLLDPKTRRLGPGVEAVATRWHEQGILDACVHAGRKTLVFYCGTGWRSSAAFLVACLLGLPAKNYEDGFFGWSRCAQNEIVRRRAKPEGGFGVPTLCTDLR